MKNTAAFHGFMRGLAERRSALLKVEAGTILIYPPIGSIWEASKADIARCDAFILFFVAELEHYLEWILDSAAQSFEEIYRIYFLRHCNAGTDYIEKLVLKRKEIQRNNNANWKKISHFFEFFGMSKEQHFPSDYWDDIESVVSHRGHIAHNGARIRSENDRRDVIRKIELTIKRTKFFDEQFSKWKTIIDNEKSRLSSISLNFSPPLCHIN